MMIFLAILMISWFFWAWTLPESMWAASATALGSVGVLYGLYLIVRGFFDKTRWGVLGVVTGVMSMVFVLVGVGMAGRQAQDSFNAYTRWMDGPGFMFWVVVVSGTLAIAYIAYQVVERQWKA